ncbi:MAG: ScyD/ScyE family protein, partial [Chloroflexota bacterium]
MVRIGLALVLTLALSLGLSRVSLTQAQETHTVVISGLNAPRGMTFGPDGKLYVAEAGTGGDEQSDWVPPFRTAKIGKTGRIVRIDDGKAIEVASDLQSVALGPQAEIVGAQELAFIGDTLYAVVGQANALPGGKETFSLLVKIGADGKAETVADLGKYEKENNPDGTVPDSNPFGLAATPDGNLYVVDAGGNDLLKVTPDGEISTVIAWKDNAVPTSVAFDKSGQAYVTFLSPFPFAVGSSRLERLNGATSQVVVPALTTGVDVKVGPDGNVYVLEHTAEQLPGPPPHFKEKSGRVLRVTPGGLEAVATGLNFPTKMAFGPDGALYIANNAVGPAGSGEIIKMTLPEKGTPVTVAPPAPAAAAPSPAAKPSA